MQRLVLRVLDADIPRDKIKAKLIQEKQLLKCPIQLPLHSYTFNSITVYKSLELQTLGMHESSSLTFLCMYHAALFILFFTNLQNLITDSGIHPSLHSNCHHQIIYGKFNLKNFYPPPYERHIWHYKYANTDMISKAIQGFDWGKAFLGKSTEEKASILTKTILNILSNFIPNEKVTIDDRDPP